MRNGISCTTSCACARVTLCGCSTVSSGLTSGCASTGTAPLRLRSSSHRRPSPARASLGEATEQSGRGVVPQLGNALPLRAALKTAHGATIVAYEGERDRDLRSALDPRPQTVSLFVGPEGGFEPAEVQCARDAGAEL